MQFFHSEWLNGLWLVAGLAFVFIWNVKRKQKVLEKFGDLRTVNLLKESHSGSKERFKNILTLIITTLLFFTLAQPQWGEIKKEMKRKGVEIVFLVDASLSMLAEDIKPNRIGQAKLIMKSFLKQLKGDRVGIVTFAGSGFVQSPLTLDYDAFILFASSIQVGLIPDAGTSLSEAIHTAIKAFLKEKQKNYVIILLSDGEDLEGQMDRALEIAKETKVRIYAIGTGTEDGSPIPLRSEQGKVSGYKKDREGQVVITRLNEPLLKQLAEETGGLYFPSSNSRGVEWIYQHMQNIEKREFKQQLVTEKEDHYQAFLILAVILLILEFLIGETMKEPRKS